MTLGPVVSSSGLSKNEVVWSEDLSVWSWPDGVHGTGLQINENSTGNVFASWSLIVVNIDTLQLEVKKSRIEQIQKRERDNRNID